MNKQYQAVPISIVCSGIVVLLTQTASCFAQNLADPIVSDKEQRKAEAWFKKGHAAFEKKHLDDAEKCYRKGIELEPNEARFHRQLALLLLKERRMPQAERESRIDLSQDPEDWRGYLVLGSILHVLRRYDEECETYKKTLLVLPNDQVALKAKLEKFIYADTAAVEKETRVKQRKKELEDEQYKDVY